MRIGIDLMGGDRSPKNLFEAVQQAVNQHGPSHTFVVFASKEVAEEACTLHCKCLGSSRTARVEFHLVNDYIAMSDEPLSAVRHKKGSSLFVGMRMLKKRQIDALVTVGNTGALIAASTLTLPMLPTINRPALLAILPTEKGSLAVIDVGGNVYCKAHHLVQFAQMGAIYQQCSRGIERPVVGLLNIGIESKKGTSELRQAYRLLQNDRNLTPPLAMNSYMQFIGNVEGKDLFQGKTDVLVTDGFSGNVLLKTTEGVSSYIFDHLERRLPRRSAEALGKSVQELKLHFDYAEYPGAVVCGIDGVVVKCHGYSSPRALYNGIQGAVRLVEKALIKRLKERLCSS